MPERTTWTLTVPLEPLAGKCPYFKATRLSEEDGDGPYSMVVADAVPLPAGNQIRPVILGREYRRCLDMVNGQPGITVSAVTMRLVAAGQWDQVGTVNVVRYNLTADPALSEWPDQLTGAYYGDAQ